MKFPLPALTLLLSLSSLSAASAATPEPFLNCRTTLAGEDDNGNPVQLVNITSLTRNGEDVFGVVKNSDGTVLWDEQPVDVQVTETAGTEKSSLREIIAFAGFRPSEIESVTTYYFVKTPQGDAAVFVFAASGEDIHGKPVKKGEIVGAIRIFGSWPEICSLK